MMDSTEWVAFQISIRDELATALSLAVCGNSAAPRMLFLEVEWSAPEEEALDNGLSNSRHYNRTWR